MKTRSTNQGNAFTGEITVVSKLCSGHFIVIGNVRDEQTTQTPELRRLCRVSIRQDSETATLFNQLCQIGISMYRCSLLRPIIQFVHSISNSKNWDVEVSMNYPGSELQLSKTVRWDEGMRLCRLTARSLRVGRQHSPARIKGKSRLTSPQVRNSNHLTPLLTSWDVKLKQWILFVGSWLQWLVGISGWTDTRLRLALDSQILSSHLGNSNSTAGVRPSSGEMITRNYIPEHHKRCPLLR